MMRISVNYVRPEPHEQLASRAEQRAIRQELHREDQTVRAHEGAHLRLLGGAAAGPVIYDTVSGPDGRSYAIAAKIKVDLSPVPGNPQASLRKARQVRLAALAPNDPSGPDMRVAAAAYRMEMVAKRELDREDLPEKSSESAVDLYA